MPPVSPQRLRELEDAVFVKNERTVQEAAERFSRNDLISTIREARRSLRCTATRLPDAAFAQQPGDEAGQPVWSAGEIAGHITESMLWLQFALHRLVGDEPEGAPSDKPGISVRDRDSTLDLLDRADRELERAISLTSDIGDEPRTPIDWLGDVGVRGLLLLHAMHEWEHAGQVAGLGVGQCPASRPE